MRNSFTLRVFILYFIVMGLPILIDSLFFYERSYSSAVQNAKANIKESVEIHMAELSQLKPTSAHFLQDVSYFMHLDEGVHDELNKTFKDLSEITYVNFFLLSPPKEREENLMIMAASDPAWVGQSLPTTPKIDQLMFKGSSSSLRYLPSFLANKQIAFVQGSSVQKEGKVVSLLFAFTLVEDRLDHLLNSEKSKGIDFALLDEQEIVIASSKKGLLGKSFTSFIEKQNYITYQKTDEEAGYSLVAFMPKGQFIFASQKHLLFFYILYIALNVCGAILAYLLSIWISKPLNQLNTKMIQVSQGDYSARFTEGFLGSEINRLGNLYNATLDALLANMKKAEESQVERMTYQKEIEVGREIQSTLLSSVGYQFPFAELSTKYLPAKEVGGDFFSIEKRGEEDFWFSVGDASGKGISSSLFALTARSLIRTYAIEYQDVALICAKTNNAFMESAGDTGMFVTALVGSYLAKTKTLTYYSCGHPPGLVRKRNGTVIAMEHAGMALGLLKAEKYVANSMQLEEGDLLLFYTKGLIDGVNERGQMFSKERVKDLLRQRKWESAYDLVEGLTSEFKQFTSDIAQEDEVVIMGVLIR